MDNKENISRLEAELDEIEKRLKEVITNGLEIIKADPSQEKKILTMIITPVTRIYEYFIKETKRTGTESVGKSASKYAMYKKF